MSKLFGVGMFKTGTTSLASILGQVMYIKHEGDIFTALDVVEGLARGHLGTAEVYSYLTNRQHLLGLDADILGFLYPFTPYLIKLYPQARFIITIRPCEEWIRSCLQSIRLFQGMPNTSRVHYLARAVGTDPAKWPAWDNEAAEFGSLSVEKLACMWRDVNNFLLSTIPPVRRLLLHTDELGGDLSRLATFLSLPPDMLHVCWLNKMTDTESSGDFFTTAEQQIIKREAGEMMAKLFPGRCEPRTESSLW